MLPFMVEIEAAQRSPLDQLAFDFFANRSGTQSMDFCRRAAGLTEKDLEIAQRLHVSVTRVRGWREVGRKWSKWYCQ